MNDTQKIKDEVREKIGRKYCEENDWDYYTPWGKKLGDKFADQILSLSGETDEVCNHTAKDGWRYNFACPLCSDTGTIHTKWHIEIVEG